MKAIVIYDIEENRVRVKVADACLDYGMTRVQLSMFFGELSRARQSALTRRIAGTAAYVLVVPVCERDIAALNELGAPLRGTAPDPAILARSAAGRRIGLAPQK